MKVPLILCFIFGFIITAFGFVSFAFWRSHKHFGEKIIFGALDIATFALFLTGDIDICVMIMFPMIFATLSRIVNPQGKGRAIMGVTLSGVVEIIFITISILILWHFPLPK